MFDWHTMPYTNFHDLNMDWLLNQMKDVIKTVQQFEQRIITAEEAVKKIGYRVNDIENFIDGLKQGNMPVAMQNALRRWVADNLVPIVSDLIKMVFFGLEDGHFVAYIPKAWKDIIFSTITDYDSEYYGCLVLNLHVVDTVDLPHADIIYH